MECCIMGMSQVIANVNYKEVHILELISIEQLDHELKMRNIFISLLSWLGKSLDS